MTLPDDPPPVPNPAPTVPGVKRGDDLVDPMPQLPDDPMPVPEPPARSRWVKNNYRKYVTALSFCACVSANIVVCVGSRPFSRPLPFLGVSSL